MKPSYLSNGFLGDFCPWVRFAPWNKGWVDAPRMSISSPNEVWSSSHPMGVAPWLFLWVRSGSIPVSKCGIGATLGYFVLHILGMSPKEQVIRITTRRIVAFVTNAHHFRYSSKMENPTISVRSNIFPECVGVTIAPHMASARPQPAFIWSSFVDFIPKQSLVFFRQLRNAILSLSRIHSAIWVRVLSRVQRLMHSSFIPESASAHN